MTPVIEFDDPGKIPPWFQESVKGEQAMEDRKYADRVKIWHTNNANWLINVRIALDNNLPVPAPPTIPTKQIFGVVNMQEVSYVWQDPALKSPKIPTVVTNPDNPGFGGTDVGARDAVWDARLKGILDTVLAIKAKTDKLP